jgi:hypothetical protein
MGVCATPRIFCVITHPVPSFLAQQSASLYKYVPWRNQDFKYSICTETSITSDRSSLVIPYTPSLLLHNKILPCFVKL